MSKENIRMRIWQFMEKKGIACFPKPVFHRIPNFVGAEEAARKLRELSEYKVAKNVFCTPDSPQRPVRKMVLEDSKLLVMATPRLKKGFLMLNPTFVPRNSISEASTIRGAFKYGRFVKPSEVKVDLFIAGSVAVSQDGGRLGKGRGYSDQEYSVLKDSGSFTPQTLVITTIHDIQIVEKIPTDEWDVPVNIIVTPTRVIRVT